MLKRLFACLAITAALITHGMAQAVTFNTATTCAGITLSNGNLTASFVAPPGFGDDWIAPVNSLIPIGSKVYFEFVQSSYTTGGGGANLMIGAMNLFYSINCGANSFPGDSAATGFIENNLGQVVINTVFTTTLAPWTVINSNIGVALDLVNNKFWARVNGGNWNNDVLANQNPATDTGGQDISSIVRTALIPFVMFRDNGGGTMNGQFASASWTYSAPSGFTQLVLPPVKGFTSASALGGTNIGIKGNAAAAVVCPASCGAVVFNVVSDFGAACNGTGDDAPFFSLARNVITSDPRVIAGANVVLTVPPGSNCIFNSCGFSNFSAGMNDFIFVLTGATLNGAGGGCEQWGNSTIVSGTNPLINTVSAGASCVTTITPSDAGNFPVGRWAMLNGLGLQGSGFPPNFAVWEYVQVASRNAGTGQICFTTNLINAYKSTWTDLGSTNCAGNACGGAGRLQLMDSSWGHTYTMIGGTWEFWSAPLFYSSRNVVINGTTWIAGGPNNPNCFTPTLSGTITFNNVTVTNCGIEADKEVESWIVNNSNLSTFFQSASFHNLTLNSSAVPFLNGTAENTVCNNSTIGSQTTPTGGPAMFFDNSFGVALSFTGINCHFKGTIRENPQNPGGTFGTSYPNPYSYAGGGVVQVIGANNGGPGFNPFSPPQMWKPGTVNIFSNSINFSAGFPFTVTDNSCVDTQGSPPCVGGQLSINTTIPGSTLPPGGAALAISSGSYVSGTGVITLTTPSIAFGPPNYVTLSSLTGTGAFAALNGTWFAIAPTSGTTVTLQGPVGAGAATITGGSATPLVSSFHPDEMRNWACSNCDGNPQAIDLSQASAQHQPLWTYSNRTYTCTANLGNIPNSIDLNNPVEYGLFGNFVSATINVSTADTGPNGTLTVGTDQFGRIPITNQVTGVNGFWGYGTNLKIAGTRTITPTTVTGAQSGDSGTFPGANTWFAEPPGTSGGILIFTSADLTTEPAAQCPVVTLTFQLSR